MHPDVLAAMARMAAHGGNPASQHQLGQAVRREVDAAAAAVAALAGGSRRRVAWLPSQPEATAWALACWQAALAPGGRGQVWLPATDAFVEARALAGERGLQLLTHLADVTAAAPAFVAVAVAAAAADADDLAAAAARAAGAHLHWAVTGPLHGSLPAGVADSVAVAATCLGGPPGVAALVADAVTQPAGTLPRELVAGFGAAARRLANGG